MMTGPIEDVLAEGAAKAGLPQDALATLTGWLAACLERDAYAELEHTGDPRSGRIPAARLFVDLVAANLPLREAPAQFRKEYGVLHRILSTEAKRVVGSSWVGTFPEDRDGSLDEGARGESNGFVLIGGPGQGKTTIARFGCQLLRASLLRPRRAALSSQEQEVLDGFCADLAQGGEASLPARPLFPVHIVLRELADWLAKSHPNDDEDALFAFIAERISRRRAAPLPAAQLRSLLIHTPLFLVLDGLDEVPPAAGRDRVLSVIAGALGVLEIGNATGLLLATTRPQGYAGELTRLRLSPLHLAPMSRERALRCAERLIAARHAGDAEKGEKIMDRIRQAAEEDTVSRLLRTPLHVAILTTLVAQLGRAPRERWQLFSRYYSIIYDREVERGGPLSDALLEHRRHIDQVHRRAGLLLQTAAEGGENADASLTREQLATIIEHVLSEAGFEREPIQRLMDVLLEATSDRLVFLAQQESGKYRFDLRSLQEMMAAWEIMHRSADVAERRLHALVPMPGFRNVLLLAASKELSETSDLQGFFVKLCERWNLAETHPLGAITLIGSHLALDLLEEGTVLGHPGYTGQLAEIAAKLVERPPDDVHSRLAAIEHPRVSEALRKAVEGATPREDQDSADVPVSGAWPVALALAEDAVEWAQAAAERWWAVKERRRGLLGVLSGSRVEVGQWLGGRILESLDVLPPGFSGLPIPLAEYKTGELIDTVASLMSNTHVAMRMSAPLRHGGDDSWIGVLSVPTATAGNARQAEWWRSLLSVTHPPTSWRPWIAFAFYLQQPSCHALAHALRFVALDFNRSAALAVAGRVPWPLGACLQVAADSSSLDLLADKLDTGGLGDIQDWIAAEERWQEHGILVDEIITAPESEPWCVQGDKVTFPVAVAEAQTTFSEREDSRASAERLAQAFDRTENSALRSALAEALWNELSLCALSDDPPPWHLLEPARWEQWASATKGKVSLGAIALLAPYHRSSSSGTWRGYRRALQTLGRVSHRSLRLDLNTAVAEVLFRHLQDEPASPDLWGMFFFASDFALNWKQYVRELANHAMADLDPQSKAFACAARICAGSMSMAEIPEMVRAITGAVPFRQDAVVKALAESIHGVLPLPLREEVLCTIYQTLPPRQWYLRWWAMDGLKKLTRLRAERLDDPDTWDRFAFPMPRPADLFRSSPSAPPAPPSPRIRLIALDGLRVFRKFVLTAAPPAGDAGQWLVLLGPNGTGKTTLLRGLALSLGDPDIAASFLRRSPKWLPPERATPAECTLQTEDAEYGFAIEPAEEGGDRLRPRSPVVASAPRPLVFAYGCRRGSAAAGQSRPLKWDPEAQMATLFDEEATLIHAETWLQWLKSAAESQGRPEYFKQIVRAVLAVLKSILPGVETIEFEQGRLQFEGPDVGRVLLPGLSDGYLTMTGWVVDLLARWVQRSIVKKETLPAQFHEQMTGLVLIDEIDLHLHPRWQSQVIHTVRELFPRMTFVVTTHNPLTILGAEEGEIFVLRRDDAAVTIDQVNLQKGADASQILTGPWFGLDSTIDFETRGLLDEHQRLLRVRRRDAAEEARRIELEAILRKRLVTYADTSTERLAQKIAAEIIFEREDEDRRRWLERPEAERQQIREEIKQRVLAEEQASEREKGAAT